MRPHLHRYYGYGHLHFITFSYYRRQPLLSQPSMRDRFLEILEEVRCRYRFVVVGYVVMPEHVHLLINEPELGTPSLAMQVLKQRSSRAIRHNGSQFWQLRFYDFNVCLLDGITEPLQSCRSWWPIHRSQFPRRKQQSSAFSGRHQPHLGFRGTRIPCLLDFQLAVPRLRLAIW